MSEIRNNKHPKAARILGRILAPAGLLEMLLKTAIYTIYIHYSKLPKNLSSARADHAEIQGQRLLTWWST
jgi:hypothetical protein